MHNYNQWQNKMIRVKDKLISFEKPLVMGILNVTPDSFYDGGKNISEEDIIKNVAQMVKEGCDIIDIGGYSSRPGAEDIEVTEEKRRLKLPLALVTKNFPNLPISVDTFRAELAEWAVSNGASMINDISGGDFDKNMLPLVRELQVPFVAMHIQGTPKNMQNNPSYKNVVDEVMLHLVKKVDLMHGMGINDVIIDPGFGFGKTLEHNYALLAALPEFGLIDVPLLVGLSRKSMIYEVLKIQAENALNGTTVLNTIALMNGANILRVHDVKAAKEAISLLNFYQKAN